MNDIDRLVRQLREFARERDWERFHTPKNLAMALAVEAAELLEQFQWLTDAESATPDEARRARIREEIADVLLYLLRLSDRLGIDALAAATDKLRANAERYPAEKVRGKAWKYDQYGPDDSDD
jgi:NTP pyrophosphatase (non-canonical NTP hydrolase)